jgi:AAA domain
MKSPEDVERDAQEDLRQRFGRGKPKGDEDAKSNGPTREAKHNRANQRRIIPIIPFKDIKLGTQRRDVVKGLIPRAGLTVMWGPPKCGKSFGAFDVSMHVALGWKYRGRRVQQGAVVYGAFEGQNGLNARVEAFRQHVLPKDHSGDIPFYLEPLTLNLVQDHRALIFAIKQQLGDQKPVIVVLDTLNRSIQGSESSDEDMTRYIHAADAIRAAFDCAVLIVHHCGIDGTRPRGHTSLTGAADAQLAVRRGANGVVVLKVEWMKDGDAEGNELAFRLEHVLVGKDEDGEDISSCIVVPVDEMPAPERKPTKLSPKDELARRTLADLAADQGNPPPATWGLPNGIQVVPTETWRTTLLSRDIVEEDRRRFWDLKNRLKVKNIVAERDQLIWLA